MSQAIISDRFPYLRLELEIGNRNRLIDALIDTGFDGSVAVPPDFLANGTRPDGDMPCALADGSEIEVAYPNAVALAAVELLEPGRARIL